MPAFTAEAAQGSMQRGDQDESGDVVPHPLSIFVVPVTCRTPSRPAELTLSAPTPKDRPVLEIGGSDRHKHVVSLPAVDSILCLGSSYDTVTASICTAVHTTSNRDQL